MVVITGANLLLQIAKDFKRFQRYWLKVFKNFLVFNKTRSH